MTGRRWQPSLGAWTAGGETRFRVWAPAHATVELLIEGPDTAVRRLEPQAGGFFAGVFRDVGAGARYRYRLDGQGPFPDPASRFQPDGVHGASAVVDPDAFGWTDAAWSGRPLDGLVIYELHVGTFSPAGTFAGVEARLPYLRDLGIGAIELMPIADFPGARNWGYDGVALFAPSRAYGHPDDLRRLVDGAHRHGLAVLLDVVYNHFGPDGAYLHAFSPFYVTNRHQSPWGAAVNLDGHASAPVREFFVENAMHWLHEYHIDGLRLDATHAMHDDGPTHFVAELTARVRSGTGGREVLLIAEDHRNVAAMVRPAAEGGWGLDAVWADDLHHVVRRLVAGDADGYYADYRGTTDEISATLTQGWLYTGQHSAYLNEARGTDPSGLAPSRFVVCLQNHDQIGNRAFGDRLGHGLRPAALRAATALLLTAPQTPLLFMGQEWAAGTPFLYFTDHHAELGRLVTEGRRQEFARFAAFADPGVRGRIPDPQSEATFLASRLDWTELDSGDHAAMHRLHAALIAIRGAHPALAAGGVHAAGAADAGTVIVRRSCGADALLGVFRLDGAGTVTIEDAREADAPAVAWTCVLSTEDPAFAEDPRPPVIESHGGRLAVHFARPAALLFERRREAAT